MSQNLMFCYHNYCKHAHKYYVVYIRLTSWLQTDYDIVTSFFWCARECLGSILINHLCVISGRAKYIIMHFLNQFPFKWNYGLMKDITSKLSCTTQSMSNLKIMQKIFSEGKIIMYHMFKNCLKLIFNP